MIRLIRNDPPPAVIVSSTLGRIRLSMMWPAISTSSTWSAAADLERLFGVGWSCCQRPRDESCSRRIVPYNRIRSVATVPFGRPRKTLYCGCRRRIGKTNGRPNLRLDERRTSAAQRISTMENQEKKSKWDELARELGAEAPPSRWPLPSRVTTATETEHDEPPRRKAAAERPPARPKASPKGWDILAADLGIHTAAAATAIVSAVVATAAER